jgi:hypothetical protein
MDRVQGEWRLRVHQLPDFTEGRLSSYGEIGGIGFRFLLILLGIEL